MPDVRAEFVKRGDLLVGRAAVTLDVAAPAGGALAQALLRDTPLPPGTVKLGVLSAAVKGNGTLAFGPEPGAAPVTLGLEAQAGAGLGAYDSAAALRADVDPHGDTLVGLDLPASGVARFVVFTGSYTLDASAGGPGLALGAAGRLSLQAGARRRGRLIVVRAFGAEPGARAALQSTWDALRLPRQVTSSDSLPPGTWLLAEVDGAFAATLGATFGYDVNWSRRVGLQGLSGDAGLRVQSSLTASLGWSTEGRFLLGVARESLDPAARVLRLRLARSRRDGASLALKGGVNLTPSTGTLLPADAAEFVAGLVGLHGAHLVSDLKAFRGWLDPVQPLPRKLAGFVAAHATRALGSVADGALAQARAEIDALLQSWDRLPHTLSSLLWTELRRGGEGLAAIEALLRALASPDDAAVLEVLRARLSQAGFLATPAGAWLSLALRADVLGALGSGRVPDDLREFARATLELLDGKALVGLARFAEQHLGLDQARRVIDAASLERLEPWLRARLEEFLGEALDLRQLEPLRAALHALDRQAQEVYREGRGALNRTYGLALDAAWSRADTRTALVDAEFDGASAPAAAAWLAALGGDWIDLLSAQPAGVRLREAWLTHGLDRRRDVRVTLPWFRGSFSELSRALARLRVSDEGDGLLLYDVEALDEAAREGRWRSRLSLSGRLTLPGVRAWGAPSRASELSLAYSFRLAFDAPGAIDLERALAPLLEFYFTPAAAGAPRDWTTALAPSQPADAPLGRLALTLDVALSPSASEAWLDAPADGDDPRYRRLSRAVQRALRRVIPACYFQDPARYAAAEFDGAAQIVVWSCLPVSSAIALDGARLAGVDLDRDVFWDVTSDAERRAMLSSPATRLVLRQRLGDIRARLEARPDLRAFVSDWADTRLDDILRRAAAARPVDLLTRSLLLSEARSIRAARDAGVGLARARAVAAGDPEAALVELARFGARLTGAFHDALAMPFAGQGPNLRMLAALVFYEGARALGAPEAAPPLARLEVMRVRIDAAAAWKREHLEGRLAAAQVERAVALLSDPG